MLNRSFKHSVGRWLTIAALVTSGIAMAQSTEPSLNQVYEAARAGKLEQAQVMMQQVLVAHPNSAKAHFVQAELSAGLGHLPRAKEEFALAEKLAPGLPFAKPEAVQKLRAQLSSTAATGTAVTPAAVQAPVAMAKAHEPAGSSFPWGIALAVGGGLIALGIYVLGKKSTPAPTMAGPIGSGLSGPQTFGAGPAYGQQPYAQPSPYGQPGAYGQAPAGSGIGGRVMGGLATGLAVGAGVMAAQAIGKSLLGDDNHPAHPNAATDNGYQPIASNGSNADFGGDNFGVNDGGSWDDGGGSFASNDGGGDWDS